MPNAPPGNGAFLWGKEIICIYLQQISVNINTHKIYRKPNKKSMPVNVLLICSYYWGKGYENDSVDFLFFTFVNKCFLISSARSWPPM